MKICLNCGINVFDDMGGWECNGIRGCGAWVEYYGTHYFSSKLKIGLKKKEKYYDGTWVPKGTLVVMKDES